MTRYFLQKKLFARGHSEGNNFLYFLRARISYTSTTFSKGSVTDMAIRCLGIIHMFLTSDTSMLEIVLHGLSFSKQCLTSEPYCS